MSNFENPEEEQFVEKTKDQIAKEELDRMELDKLVEEADEELKSQPGDYKAAYDQYLQKEENLEGGNIKSNKTKPETPKTPDAPTVVAPKANAPEAPKAPEPTPKSTPEVKPEAPKAPEPAPEKNKEEDLEVAPEGTPFQAKNREKELKEREGAPFQKKEDADEEVSLLERKAVIDAYNELSKIAKQKEGLKGLLSRLGIGKTNSEIEKEYLAAQNTYNAAINKIKNKTGESRDEIEEKYAKAGEKKETTFESIKGFLKTKKQEVGASIERLDPEKKGTANKLKNLLTNKKFQFIVGAAVLGVSLWAPPVGFVSAITGGAYSGFVPAAFGPELKAIGAAAGAWWTKGGLDDLRKAIKGKEEIDLTKLNQRKDIA